ncbi:MAG: glycosyltransferase family 2 protein [Lacipirellulaceae bacterium]
MAVKQDDTNVLEAERLESERAQGPATGAAPSPADLAARAEQTARIERELARAEEALAEARLHGDLPSVEPPAVKRGPRTKLKVSILMPVYNERNTIVEIVDRVRAQGLHDELLIVDDCSTDGTRDLLLAIDERFADVRLVLHGYNKGKGAALRTALAEARGDVVLVQDADLEYDPRDFAKLLAPIERGEADVVYGSRFLQNAEQDPSWFHRLGNRLLTGASNLFTGLRLTDMETCYKALRRGALRGVVLREQRFGFEPEITAKLARRGCRFVEVPVAYNSRGWEEGKKIGLRDAFRALWCIVRYAWMD